jgi:hypothetical protein
MLGARHVSGYDLGENGHITVEHAAGITAGGDPLVSLSVLYEKQVGKWDVNAGAQASFTEGGPRLDIGASAATEFDFLSDTSCLTGKFTAAVLGTFGPETSCTAAAELDVRSANSENGNWFEREISASFNAAAMLRNGETSFTLGAGVYKDVPIIGRAGVEIDYDTKTGGSTVGLGLRAPF